MRTFIHSKAVATTFRTELAARGVQLSHSDSLEITAKAFGAPDWNTLSAKIKQAAASDTSAGEEPAVLSWRDLARPIYERHLTPEERAGPWAALIREVRGLYSAGADAASDEALDLADRWLSLYGAINGNSPELRAKHAAAYREALSDPQIAPKMPLSSELVAWFGPALSKAAALREVRGQGSA